jgi:hypothetical protein
VERTSKFSKRGREKGQLCGRLGEEEIAYLGEKEKAIEIWMLLLAG